MNLASLRYLVEAADAGTLQAAARRLGVTQPTLSTQLSRLEAELDATLLERGPRGVRPTEAGRRVLAEAGPLLDAEARLRAAAREPGQPLAGDLRLGALPTIGPYAMPTLLPRLRAAYPGSRLLLREENTQTLLRRLAAGAHGAGVTVDAALLATPLDAPGLHRVPVAREPLRAVLPSGHPLATGGGPVAVDALAAEPMLLLEDGHCLREQTVALCRRGGGGGPGGGSGSGSGGGTRGPGDWDATSVESLRQMVAAGIGCAVLPEMAVAGRFARVAGVAVRPIRGGPTRSLVLAFRESHPRFGALRKLGHALRGWLGGESRG